MPHRAAFGKEAPLSEMPLSEKPLSEKPKKNLLLLLVPIIAIIAIVALIEGFSGEPSGAKEKKSGTLTVQQANEALHKLNKNITVDSVAKSPIDGIWEVIVTTPQGKKIAYIDTEGKYLLSGTIIELATGTDLTQKKGEDLNKVNFADISLDHTVMLGNPKATKKVIVFDDPD